MAKGTLVVSREVNNHSLFKQRLEALGFHDVTLTDCEKDALNFKIRDLQPKLLIMDAFFYECCTPYLMGELKKMFPKINMAAVCIGHYPEDYAISFIYNGVKSYATSYDGFDKFYKGLEEIGKGGEYISPAVQERIDLRKEYPAPAGNITERYKQVIRLLCCGFTDNEVADTMHITKGSVENYKSRFFPYLNVRSTIELIRAVLTIGIVKLEEIYFYPKGLTLNPRPDKKLLKEKKK